MTNVWVGIVGAGPLGGEKQRELSDPKYAHIKELLQAMPMPENTAAKDAGDKLQDGLTKKIFGVAAGINDEVAIPLNKALETKESRDFVVKIAHDHPEALGKAVDAIVAHPDQATQIMAQAEAQYKQQAGQTTAKTETPKPPEHTASQEASAPKPEHHETSGKPAPGGAVTADTAHHAPVATHRHEKDARVEAFQKGVLYQAEQSKNPALAAELGKGRDDGLLGEKTLDVMKKNGIDVSMVKDPGEHGVASKAEMEALFNSEKNKAIFAKLAGDGAAVEASASPAAHDPAKGGIIADAKASATGPEGVQELERMAQRGDPGLQVDNKGGLDLSKLADAVKGAVLHGIKIAEDAGVIPSNTDNAAALDTIMKNAHLQDVMKTMTHSDGASMPVAGAKSPQVEGRGARG